MKFTPRHRGTGGRVRFSLVPSLLAAAAVLLVLEVAVCKLALPAWLERRRAAIEPEARLAALSAARRRATRRVRDEAVRASPSGGTPATAPIVPPPASPESASLATAAAGQADAGKPAAAPQPAAPAEDAEDGYTSRLLAAKRRLQSGRRSV